jgi:ABC-type antimicrobial peptide transport system permease subunit
MYDLPLARSRFPEHEGASRRAIATEMKAHDCAARERLYRAYAATRTLTSFLYGISPTDPFAFGGAALLLTAVAIIASFIPMRRALRVDPIDALRAD